MINILASGTDRLPVDLETLRKSLRTKCHITQLDLADLIDGQNNEQVINTCSETSVIILRTGSVNTRVLEACPKLKLVIAHGTGVDSIDITQCQKQSIRVCNTPYANTQSVIELTIALILNSLRAIPQAHLKLTQNKNWNSAVSLGIELSGKTVGIIGFGATGKGVAQVCKALGANVVATRRTKTKDPNTDVPVVDLDNLLNCSDIVTLHLPLTDDSREMVNKPFLAKMKAGAYLINVSRGAIIDEPALIEALKSGQITVAALDVFSVEPADFKSELFALPNVVVTPHIGSSTKEALQRIAQMAAAEVDRYFEGLPAINEVIN